MFPFDDDVVQFIVLLTQHGTVERVRAAIAQSADAMSFASPPVSPEGVIHPAAVQRRSIGADDRGDDGETGVVSKRALLGVHVPLIAVCEIADNRAAADGSQIIATADPTTFFRSVSCMEDATTEEAVSLGATARDGTGARRSTGSGAGDDSVPGARHKAKALSCILLERRDLYGAGGATAGGGGARTLSVRDLYIQSVDLQRPLDALQSILRNIYDPMLRSHKTQSALRTHVQDLLSSIRSMHNVLPEIDVTRYVHEDLLQLCDANPLLDVPQLIDRLGEVATDPSFIRRVLQVRNRCKEALSMEPLLSGKLEEEELAKELQSTNSKAIGAPAVGSTGLPSGLSSVQPQPNVSATPLPGAAAGIGYDGDDGDDSVRVVQERILYWRCVHAWMEDVLKQLRGREWRLVHRLLAQRVETDYVGEYVGYLKLAQEYIAFLSTIPEKRLANVQDMKELNDVADEIIVAATQPTRFAARLQLSLLTSLVWQISSRWVSVMETQQVLRLDEDPDAATVAAAGDANGTQHSADVAAAVHADPFVPLQTLRIAIHSLRTLQSRYVEHSTQLRHQIRAVRNPREHVEHPRVEALLARCVAVRDLIEEHLLLMRQLGVVFSTKMRLQFAKAKRDTMTPMGAAAAQQQQPGEEYALVMQDAFNECVSAVCGWADDAEDLQRSSKGSAGESAASSGSPHRGYKRWNNYLWRTSPAAVQRFSAAVQEYQHKRSQCDEQIALVVSQLLSNQQHAHNDGRSGMGGAGAGGMACAGAAMRGPQASANHADNHGLRLFRTFQSFKMLPLERVQRVVHSYQDAVAEKLSAYVSYIQDCYVNVPLTKQEVSYNMARFSVSALVAQIMWEQRLAEALTKSMMRFDYVSEHGWHQLLHLRNVEHYWRLNASLAEFIGVPLNLLACDELQLDSEVHGCAVALACLSLHYTEEAGEWEQDEHLRVAQDLVATRDPGALAVARDRMLIGGAPRLYKATARVRDIRSSRDIIQQRIESHMASWFEEVDRLIGGSGLDQQTLLLSGPVLWAVNCGPFSAPHNTTGGAVTNEADSAVMRLQPSGGAGTMTGGFTANTNYFNTGGAGSMPRASSFSPSSLALQRAQGRSASPSVRRNSFLVPVGNGDNESLAPAAAATSAANWMMEVAFPWSFPTIAEDLRYLESAHLTSTLLSAGSGDPAATNRSSNSAAGTTLSPCGRCAAVASGLAFLRDALRGNELRSRLAHTLVELIHVYYVTVKGEDTNLVLLATDEYQEVNRLFQKGIALRWSDEGLLSYVQQLSDTMQAFTTTVQQLRCKTELVYRKIRAFLVRAFHPEAILQRVKALRRIVDTLALRCVHTHLWTRQIQPLLEQALLTQMKYLMHSWTEDFLSMRGDVRFLEKGAETDVFRLTPLRVRMRVVYKEVRLESCYGAWRQHWIGELNRFFSWIDVLPRLYKEEETQADVVGVSAALGSDMTNTAGCISLAPSHRGNSVPPAAAGTHGNSGANGAGVNAGIGGAGNNAHNVAGGRTPDDGYQYLLLRLPSSALAEPLHAIEQCVQDAIDTENEWRYGQQFLSMDVALMQQRFGRDLRRWSHALRLMHTVTSRIMDYTQPNKLLGGIVILAQEAQIELGRKLDQVRQYAHAKFKDLLQGEQERAFSVITQERTKIDALDVISNAKDAAAFLSEAPRLKSELQKLDGDITLMDNGEVSLQKLGHVFPENWMYATALREEYTSLAELVDRKLKAVQVRRPFLIEEAKSAANALEVKVAEVDGRFHNVDTIAVSKEAPVLARQMVSDIYDEAVAFSAEAKQVAAIQEALGESPHVFASLQKLLADVARVKDVWGHVASAYVELNELGATPFFEMVPRRLHERLQQMDEVTDAYQETMQGYQLYQNLKQKLRRVLSYNRLMQDLRSDAMSPLERSMRHWTALQHKLRAPWVLTSLTVANIWESDPGANAAAYSEVIEMAQGERRIEVQLHNISNYWSMFEFSVVVYKKQVALIRGWDEVFERLTEDLSTFGGMRASPYFVFPQLVSMTNDAEARLDRLRQVLEVLLEVQKRWVYLDGILSENAEVRVQLPHDTVKFDRTSRELLHILPRPRSSGNLPELHVSFFLEDEKLKATLERLLSQLAAVQRALTSYLDTQRSRFPRFFFAGDDDLLEIMGNSKNPLFLNKHLKKMFTALASLQLDGNVKDATTRLRGFSSAEGEEVSFQPGPISYGQRPIHEWLGEAEQGMVYTLREATLRAYNELVSTKDASPYALLWSMDWMRQKPTQVVCLALQLLWTREQESLLTGAHGGGPGAGAADARRTSRAPSSNLSVVTTSMDDLLARLAGNVLRNAVAPSSRRQCEQLITIAVYQRDVSRTLAARKVASRDDFSWLSVLRLYVVPTHHQQQHSGKSMSNLSNTGLARSTNVSGFVLSEYRSAETLECRMADASVLHGFEYIGAYERLVQTPLTDKCYLTLMQALHTRLGGSPVGPAGTGKTETVKALGMQLGRHVLVFNCDDTFDYQAVSRIFLGLCQVGAWGCFDEFNRLEERILSALSLQIQVIQQSLRAQQREVQLNHRVIPLHSNVAIFITMNPGYAGRSKLPGNLKQLFRTVTMTIPDRETIAEVLLFAQGFTTAEALSQKVVPLFRLCEDQFTRQAHYDFGLRALKSVLVAAGDRKRQVAVASRGNRSCHNAAGGAGADAVQETERTLLLESIIATVAPKLVAQDAALFYPLLHDFFPDCSLPALPMDELREAVECVCAESGLSPAAGWMEKVLQLYHTKMARHGVMIVGPSGTGKTTAWKVLMAAMVRLERALQMHAYVISPKVLSKGELFGTLDVTTREWRDGVFTSILRKIIDAEEQQQIPDDLALAGNDDTDHQVVAAPSVAVDNKTRASQKRNATRDGDASALGAQDSEARKEHWIIFDGDVDPEWVENLNSVLDDNRLLTLPNGERLPLPRSVHIIFEVQDLLYATPATVSRCGMLWFSEGVVPLSGVLAHAYHQLQEHPIVDARGRHLHWGTDHMIGVTGAQSPFYAECLVTGEYGKVYHEFVLSSTRASVEEGMAGSLPRHHGRTSSGDEGITAFATPRRSSHPCKDATPQKDNSADLDMGDTLCGTAGYGNHTMFMSTSGGGASTLRRSHPDAERIQELMVNSWAAAFEKDGAVVRGLQLMKSAAFRDVCVMMPSDLQRIQSMVAFLVQGVWRTFETEQQNNGGVFSDAVVKKIAMQMLSYAIFWGLASAMSLENRMKLAQQLGLRPTVDGVAQSMVEVEVCYRTGEWRLIRNRVKEISLLAEQVGANDTVITTVDTCRHEDVLSAWLGAGRSAILCGPPGSGKTMSITAVLSSLPEYEVVFLNFSSGTTVKTIMKALEQHCRVQDTARGLVMAPTSGKQLLLFCDEVNLPALDRYGTQVVVQLLRQLIERNGFYRARDNTWITVEGVQVVGACNPPTDPGRVPLSARFLRWAPVLLVDFPSPESLKTIYETYCRAILAWNERLSGQVATRLAQAMVKMYRVSQAKFTPIQQPHYLYSPRELSRWSRALYEGILTWDDAARRRLSVSQLVRLAVHEGLRVFADRLVTAEERAWTDTAMVKAFREFFTDVDDHAFHQPLLYSTLLSRSYTDSPREELRAYVQKKLTAFNEEESLGNLVIYDAMIDHVVRIDRVLRQPLGHLLIAGSSGVGKTALTKLVAWMRGFSIFALMLHRGYDLDDFEHDLRGVLRRAGCKRERICFLFDESDILQPSFLEYMNALLASGEVPGLFDGDEWSKLMQDVRDAVLASQSYYATSRGAGAGAGAAGRAGGSAGDGGEAGRDRDSPALRGGGCKGLDSNDNGGSVTGSRRASVVTGVGVAASAAADDLVDVHNEAELYHWFLTNVRENLHVVLTINPSSGELTSRTVASPALVNRCTIDWFGDWDTTTLHQVCHERIRHLALLPACHGVFATEVEVKEAVVESLCAIHVATQHINQALRVRHANQGTFVTPRHFTDCVSHFATIFQEKQRVSSDALVHLRSGLKKLELTAQEVAAQRATLQDNEAEIEASSRRAQAMLERIVSETDVAKREKAAAQDLERQLQDEHAQISEDALRLSIELAEAEPALREADAALSRVKPEYLREIRAYATPPPMVKRTLEAVGALMGERNCEDWDSLKNCIRRDDFLASVRNFRPDDITEPARERVRGMMRDSKFTVEAAYRASKAAGPLMQWVFFQVKYSAIYQRVAPVRSKIEKLIKARDVKLKGLEVAQEEVRQKENSLQQLMGEYQNATAQIAELKQRITAVSAKCNRAQTILRQLLDERDRWEEEVHSFDSEARTTLGDCVVSAVFLAYTGFYDEHTRERVLMPRWMACLQRATIPVRKDLSVTEYLSPATQQLAWEEAGLPKDRLNIDNAVIMHRSQRYVLLIDPTDLAAHFVLRYYGAQKITKTSFSRPGYVKQLEMAVRFGYPILMEDAEHLDPAVAPLLNGEVRCHGTRHITRIGPHEVDLAPSFHLFLHTRNPNFQPPPDLAGQVCMVNFTVTLSSLQSQCLHYTLLHERPDVDAKRSKLLKAQGEYQLRLRVLEEKLLTRIAEAEGSLLDNNALIESLTELKEEATCIAGDIADSENSMREIRGVEDMYRPIATVVAQAHFALQRFEALSPYYCYDVRFVLRVLDDALQALPATSTPAADGGLRLQQLTYGVFVLLHRRVVRGMFHEDHLVWALRLAQLRSAMSATGAKSASAAPAAASVMALPTSSIGGSAVMPEEWEWVLSCLRAAGSGAGAAGAGAGLPSAAVSRTVTTDSFEGGGASSPITAATTATSLPPVVRQACPALGLQSCQALAFLLAKPAFNEVRETLTTRAPAWEAVLTSATPVATSESALPSECFPPGASRVRRLLLLALVLLNTRRDAFIEAVRQLLASYFSPKEMGTAAAAGADSAAALFTDDFFAPQTNDLADGIMAELSAATPLLMVTDTMFDPALRVEELAQRTDTTLNIVAMGSMESIVNADAYLAEATKLGGWVLLKNVHLARGYMDKLEKQLHFQRSEGQLHKEFRLFLTAELDRSAAKSSTTATAAEASSKVLPINLIEASVVVVYEAPPGMQSSLLQTYGEYPAVGAAALDGTGASSVVPSAGAAAASSNTSLQRLYLAAAWLHSVIAERILYKPLGWSEAYEYTEVEYQRVVQAVQAWSSAAPAAAAAATASSSNAGTLKVSWDALHTIVATTVYGGKVSNIFDQHLLNVFCRRVLRPEMLQDAAQFVSEAAAAGAPPPPIRGRSRAELLQWIHALPGGSSHPAWLALPIGADRMTRARSAIEVVERLSLVQSTLDDELTFTDIDSDARAAAGGTGSTSLKSDALRATRWAAKVQSYCAAWYPILRDALRKLEKHPFVLQAVALHEQETVERASAADVSAANEGRVNLSGASHPGGVAAPLVLAMQREVVAAVELVRHLLTCVRELREVVMEERTPSSVHRSLVEELMKDHVPDVWAAHLRGVHGSAAHSLFVGLWIADVQQRVEHLLELATAAHGGQLAKTPVRLGALFSPGAFLTAFKQHCARAEQVPLEQLVPQVEVAAATAVSAGGALRTASSALSTTGIPAAPATAAASLAPRRENEMVFTGLTLHSAQVGVAGKCTLSSATVSGGAAPALSSAVVLRWRWVRSTDSIATTTALTARLERQTEQQQSILLPFYTTENREALLEVLELPKAPNSGIASGDSDAGVHAWYERGVCVAAWSASE
ncbi:putative dynein heavy chain, cytosolic [Leishmania mexicana MHOM/GT/2001/U1103]|uniref:Dynein heavy chain, cytosolic n=1 Tax=Leishmania mexicana (strain MHOM/GT/2001/U1103) TaxID=929439 RepID=E9AVU3_LEIMU|nr:putative dynein heavy chain, cytosolic [Leishmania mexicana MHOM/GT/2001/U1103]CBZ27076.1 putative dynein heavy chain, cytosolic [Leishmania mexicana MHOM/GT/2001/U1103]